MYIIAKRYKDLFKKVIAPGSILLAHRRAEKNKRYRAEILKFNQFLGWNLNEIIDDLVNGTYKPGKYRMHWVYEPKKRRILALPFRDRIVQHAIHKELNNIYEKIFCSKSYACRKGKGQHKASNDMLNWLRDNGENMNVLSQDIRKFFDSVDRNILFKLIKKKIKDEKVLNLLKVIIFVDKNRTGIPIGNLTSQLFANIYLNELDRFIIDELRIKTSRYFRYMDNFIIFDESKDKLREFRNKIRDFLRKELKLELNREMDRLHSVKKGTEFVGFKHFQNRRVVRRSSLKRIDKGIKKRIKELENGTIDVNSFRSSVYSYIGSLKHGLHSRKLEDYVNTIEFAIQNHKNNTE